MVVAPRGHSRTTKAARLAKEEEAARSLVTQNYFFRSPLIPRDSVARKHPRKFGERVREAEGSRVKRLPEVPGRRAQKVGGGGDGSARSSRAGPRGQNRNRNPRAPPPAAVARLVTASGPLHPVRAPVSAPETRRTALRTESLPLPPLLGGRASGPGRDLPLLAGAAAYQSVGEEPPCHCGRSAGASEGWGAAPGAETGSLSARRPEPGGGGAEQLRALGPGTWGGASPARDGARRGGGCGHERPAAPDRAGTRGLGPADSGQEPTPVSEPILPQPRRDLGSRPTARDFPL